MDDPLRQRALSMIEEMRGSPNEDDVADLISDLLDELSCADKLVDYSWPWKPWPENISGPPAKMIDILAKRWKPDDSFEYRRFCNCFRIHRPHFGWWVPQQHETEEGVLSELGWCPVGWMKPPPVTEDEVKARIDANMNMNGAAKAV
jgi:hypothetical protein